MVLKIINDHLFFRCHYSKECLVEVKNWLSIRTTVNTPQQLVNWCMHRRCSTFRKQVYYASIAALIYMIWFSRNQSYWNQNIPTV